MAALHWDIPTIVSRFTSASPCWGRRMWMTLASRLWQIYLNMNIHNETLLMTSNCKSESLSKTSVKCSRLTCINYSFPAMLAHTATLLYYEKSSGIHYWIDIQEITLIPGFPGNKPRASYHFYWTFTTLYERIYLNLPLSYLMHVVYWSLFFYSPLSSAQQKAVQRHAFDWDRLLCAANGTRTNSTERVVSQRQGALHWLINVAACLVVNWRFSSQFSLS